MRRELGASGTAISEPWKAPGVTCSSHGDARLGESHRIGDVLVAERIELADVDVGGRQPAELVDRRAAGGGVDRHIGAGDAIAEV